MESRSYFTDIKERYPRFLGYWRLISYYLSCFFTRAVQTLRQDIYIKSRVASPNFRFSGIHTVFPDNYLSWSMLTFFRRIRKGFIGSGQASRYILYAIGEIALVVIGILLALQINNWNQNRLDRIKEKILLDEINKEFQFNRDELNETLSYYQNVYDNCISLRNLFPIDPRNINLDSISQYLENIHGIPSADLSMGSISALVNSSSFEIISDSELRSLLVQWQDLIEDYFDVEANCRDFTRGVFLTYLSQRVPRPFKDGIKDTRVDLSFVKTIEFENMIKNKQNCINSMLVIGGNESRIKNSINRIIELTGTSKHR